jgi:hypothetical protein
MLPNIKGEMKPTKELHNYIHKCMENVFKEAYKSYLNYEGGETQASRDIRKLIEIINNKMIKE